VKKEIEKIYPILLGILLIILFYLRFEPFFPNSKGMLGHDYSLFLPHLLDGAYWFETNGVFEIPWFTPSFGGGLPKFPNPQSMYYSVPQFLTFFFDPLSSVKITIVLFGILGFWGLYFFLRKVFQFEKMVALFGATLFLFNGFYLSRMIVGHLTYHSYMLLPLLALFTFHRPYNKGIKRYSGIVPGGLIIAYSIYSGGFHIVPIILLSLLLFYVILNLTGKIEWNFPFFSRLGMMVIIGGFLSAAVLNAGISYISLFKRDFYPLPGFENSNGLLIVWFKSLFLKAPVDFANQIYINKLFPFGVHEFEYGLTFIPLIFILIGAFTFFKTTYSSFFSRKMVIFIFALCLLLSIPLIMNYYTPLWNSILKSIPFISNSSTLIRWFAVYIPTIIVFCTLSLQNLLWFQRYRNQIALAAILATVIVSNYTIDKRHYHRERYNPNYIIESYKKLKSNTLIPTITTIGTAIVKNGQLVFNNDLFTEGYSQSRPYEPIFGYKLEQFPKKTLVDGPVMKECTDGLLNIKNPVSYVFPKENNLSPGDHFTVAQKASAEQFCKYQNFPFQQSIRQRFANVITLISIGLLVLYGFGNCILILRRHCKPAQYQ
jgi:hypothetical protein